MGSRVLWVATLGAGLLGALGLSCTLELDGAIACGDGYVDEEAGEECDPADPDSYLDACLGTSRPDGDGACDPVTCEIINDRQQCAVCGDGHIDGDEQCDGDQLNGACDGGVGVLQCTTDCRYDYSNCKKCGNKVRDPGEECDPNADPDDLTEGKPSCAELESPFPGKPYTSGQPGTCNADCRWERTGCSYCGDGQVDDAIAVDFNGNQTIAEWCDGTDFDSAKLERELGDSACSLTDPNLRPAVECASSCLDFVEMDECCLRTGSSCPSDESPVRCCFELENPDSPLRPCQVIVLQNKEFSEVCR